MTYDVSVLMFTYRPKNSIREKFVIDAVQSLRAQEGIDIQAVILDDGSAKPIPEKYLQNTINVDIEYIKFDENRGKHKMMDIGLPLMEAELMTTLHDDDYYHTSECLKKRYGFFLEEDNTAMIFTNAIYDDRIKKKSFQLYPDNKKIKHSHEALLGHCYICGASYLIRTDLKQRFKPHPSLVHGEEYDIWCQVSKYARDNGLKIRYSPEVTVVYRFHREQTWHAVRRLSAKQRGEQYLDFIRDRSR